MSINSKITEQEIGIEFKVSKFKLWRQSFVRFCKNKPFGAVGGLIVAVILQLFYNYLVSKIDSLVNTMEDASITLVDILVKNKLSK